ALAAVLVVTGWRLVSLQHARHLFHHYGPLPALVWAATLIMVVATDLLTGVIVGLALSLVELLPHVRRLRLGIDEDHDDTQSRIALNGTATFLSLPKLSAALDATPTGNRVRLDVRRLAYVDHTCAEMLSEWLQRRRASGDTIELKGARGHLQRMVEA
ncbi:MAG: Carbonate dehydratase, partial [Rhizorhabdus sp.]|nr:Carbonate dehydratase [Rhizorhabdus sp.]